MRSRALSIATLTAIAALALSGCATSTPVGNGAPVETEPSAALFEFQTTTYGSAVDGELTIRIPEGLLDALGSDTGEILVPSVRVAARELDSSKFCAFDVTPEYAGEGFDALSASALTESEWDKRAEQEFLESIDGDLNFTSVEEAQAYVASGGEFADRVEEYLVVSGVGQYKPSPAWAALSQASPIADFDKSSPEAGVYAAADGQTITYVQACAESQTDDYAADTFWFPIQTDEGIESLATVELTVMKSGTLTVTEAEVKGFTLDSDGNWLAN